MDLIDWSSDKGNSISSATGRLVVNGTRAVQVQPDASSKAQIAALLDLLDLHFTQVDVGVPVLPDLVTLRVPCLSSEARGAAGTLLQALVKGPAVQVLELHGDDGWAPAPLGWNAADEGEYKGWLGLLALPRPVPALVAETIELVSAPPLRAYPMLSTKNRWSLRVEGLEVARASSQGMVLTVGKDGKTGDQSLQRAAWIKATGHSLPYITDHAADAAGVISKFIHEWQAVGAISKDGDEHALESRILRGACAIAIDGAELTLLQPDPVVNWGSQFPTKWGPGGKARYLDALLQRGSTPWAIEMKVPGGGGVGQYYRHAVAQAVLYREFIRRAIPLHGWFVKRGLSAPSCQAAVVVPQLLNKRQAHWGERLDRLCEAFGIAFVEVDPKHALRH